MLTRCPVGRICFVFCVIVRCESIARLTSAIVCQRWPRYGGSSKKNPRAARACEGQVLLTSSVSLRTQRRDNERMQTGRRALKENRNQAPELPIPHDHIILGGNRGPHVRLPHLTNLAAEGEVVAHTLSSAPQWLAEDTGRECECRGGQHPNDRHFDEPICFQDFG